MRATTPTDVYPGLTHPLPLATMQQSDFWPPHTTAQSPYHGMCNPQRPPMRTYKCHPVRKALPAQNKPEITHTLIHTEPDTSSLRHPLPRKLQGHQ